MSAIADISGFWLVEHHPLAGVSYRKATLEGIRHAITATNGTYGTQHPDARSTRHAT